MNRANLARIKLLKELLSEAPPTKKKDKAERKFWEDRQASLQNELNRLLTLGDGKDASPRSPKRVVTPYDDLCRPSLGTWWDPRFYNKPLD
jgi:beta-glucosidase-like glycosyl hydrolase